MTHTLTSCLRDKSCMEYLRVFNKENDRKTLELTMTLDLPATGDEEKAVEPKDPTVTDVGQVLVEVLKQALSQGRITFGVFECAELLETCPEQVMLCVLPTVSGADLTISIQHKLVEAHCWENTVNVVKVDSYEKLSAILASPEMTKSASEPIDRTYDFSCLLIGFPVDEMSTDDFHITKYSYLYSDNDIDVIELPD